MNKAEGIRGFLTFCLLLLVVVFLFFSVKFIISKRTLKEESKAKQVISVPPVTNNISSVDNALSKPPEEPISLQGFENALSLYDVRYDLNKDNVINMYDYYLLSSSLNQTSNNE
ncbi:MAG: hypothetical protein ABIB98_00250 [bacterium]